MLKYRGFEIIEKGNKLEIIYNRFVIRTIRQNDDVKKVIDELFFNIPWYRGFRGVLIDKDQTLRIAIFDNKEEKVKEIEVSNYYNISMEFINAVKILNLKEK